MPQKLPAMSAISSELSRSVGGKGFAASFDKTVHLRPKKNKGSLTTSGAQAPAEDSTAGRHSSLEKSRDITATRHPVPVENTQGTGGVSPTRTRNIKSHVQDVTARNNTANTTATSHQNTADINHPVHSNFQALNREPTPATTESPVNHPDSNKIGCTTPDSTTSSHKESTPAIMSLTATPTASMPALTNESQSPDNKRNHSTANGDSKENPAALTLDLRNKKMKPTECLLFAATLLSREDENIKPDEQQGGGAIQPSEATYQPNRIKSSISKYPSRQSRGLSVDPGAHPTGNPKDVDVLCGRGGFINKHPGNVVYRKVVDYNKPFYQSVHKKHRILVSQSIVQSIINFGGRFLILGSKGKSWYEIGYKRAVQKTSQALRERVQEERSVQDSTNGDTNHTIEVKTTS